MLHSPESGLNWNLLVAVVLYGCLYAAGGGE